MRREADREVKAYQIQDVGHNAVNIDTVQTADVGGESRREEAGK